MSLQHSQTWQRYLTDNKIPCKSEVENVPINTDNPYLVLGMKRTLMASVCMCPDATAAPTGIPTIKQTPKHAPEQKIAKTQ